MKMGKRAITIWIIAIITAILFVGCFSKEEEDKAVMQKVITIDEKLAELNGEILDTKDCDLNGDEKVDKLYIVKTVEGEKYLLIQNDKEIVDKEISRDIDKISFLSDVNSDEALDIFLTGRLGGVEPYVEMFISTEDDYIRSSLEGEEIKSGIDLNYSIFTFENKEKKGVRGYLNDESKKYLISKGYIDKGGNIHNPNIPLAVKNEAIDLRDINDDGIIDLSIKINILSEEGNVLLSKYKIYNFDIVKGAFRLKSIVNKLEDFKIFRSLTASEARELIYNKTKNNRDIIDYTLDENIETIPEEIKNKFYTFFEIYKSDNGGMASDYLILVSKDDYSMYRYYVDGLILPL